MDVAKGLNSQLNYLTVELITYSPNTEICVWSTIRFDQFDSGTIAGTITNVAFSIYEYHGTRAYRAVLEVIVALLIIYYIYAEFRIWTKAWWILVSKDNYNQPTLPANAPCCHCVLFFLYVDPTRAMNETLVSSHHQLV